MVDGRDKEEEVLTLSLTRREYSELIGALQRAEDLSVAARANELDFRMQRIRLERKLRESLPPVRDLERADTKFMSLEELQSIQRESSKRG